MGAPLVFFAQLAVEITRQGGRLVHISQVDQQVGGIPVQAVRAEPLMAQKHLQLLARGFAFKHILRHRMVFPRLRGNLLFQALLETGLGQG